MDYDMALNNKGIAITNTISIMTSQKNMSLKEKLGILTDAAKYDVACTSSGVD